MLRLPANSNHQRVTINGKGAIDRVSAVSQQINSMIMNNIMDFWRSEWDAVADTSEVTGM